MSSATYLSSPDLLFRRRMSADMNQVKTRLQTAQREVTTGLKQDRVAATNGDTAKLMSLDRDIAAIEVRATNLAIDKARAATAQSAFDTIVATTDALPVALWDTVRASSATLVSVNGLAADTALRHAVDTLNQQFAGRGLFNGASGPTDALVDPLGAGSAADALITMVRDVLNDTVTYPTLAAAQARIDALFDGTAPAPATTFNDIYAGQGDAPAADVGSDRIDYAVKADEPALRDVLKGLAMAAALDGSARASDTDFVKGLSTAAGDALQSGRDGMALIQSRLGAREARIEEILTRDTAEKTTLSLQRAQIIGVDEYEAATRVTELENQLSLIYAITARTADLSFVNFLR